jgi:hypothetical protein
MFSALLAIMIRMRRITVRLLVTIGFELLFPVIILLYGAILDSEDWHVQRVSTTTWQGKHEMTTAFG